jgi:succinyl-diaminopimelate desuccinylase
LDRGILKPSAVVVLDADDFSIIVAQKGLIHLQVKIEGKRAHGAYPWLGINAIDIASGIIQDLKNRKVCRAKNKYLKAPTVNIGTIKGGDRVNVVADWCELELDFRFLPGESAEEILAELRNIIKKHSKKFKIEIQGIQRPYQINEKHPLVDGMKKAMQKIGVKPRIKGSEGATVITFFQDKNIPAIATGFGCEGCDHIADEYVKISNLCKGAKALEEFLKCYKLN